MEVSRQDETTTIDELRNSECSKLLGIGPGGEQGYYFWYIQANHTWYRFFIQHGILFWTTTQPDPEDDLAEGETYHVVIDDTWPSEHRTFSKIEMLNGILTFSFLSNRSIVMSENEEAGLTILNML